MESVRLLDFLIFALTGGLGWWAKALWDAVSEMRRDLRELESGIPKEYVRKADWDRSTDRVIAELREFREEIRDQFESIWREMKSKQDKPGAD